MPVTMLDHLLILFHYRLQKKHLTLPTPREYLMPLSDTSGDLGYINSPSPHSKILMASILGQSEIHEMVPLKLPEIHRS